MMKKLLVGIAAVALLEDFSFVNADQNPPIPTNILDDADLNQIQNLLEHLKRYGESNAAGSEKEGILFAMRRVTDMYREIKDSEDSDAPIKESCARIIEQLELLTESIAADTADELVLSENVGNLLEEVIKLTTLLKSKLPQTGPLSKKAEVLGHFIEFFTLLQAALDPQWTENEENMEKFASMCIDSIVKLMNSFGTAQAMNAFRDGIPNELGFRFDFGDADGEYKSLMEVANLVLKPNATPEDLAEAKAKLVEMMRSQNDQAEETQDQSFLKPGKNDYQTATEVAAAA